MTHAITRYSVAVVAAIALVGWLLTLALTGAGASAAIGISGVVAAVAQIGAFALTRSMVTTNMTAAWGAGSLVRSITLVAYGLVAVKVFALPALPALLSLLVFFFLSMLLEPLFLRR